MDHLLFLVHRIPYPPNKGDKIRSYHLLKHLADRYHVHLGTFVDDPDDWQHVDKVKTLCGDTFFAGLNPRMARVRSLGALAGNRALSVDYYRHGGLQAWVDKVARQHDVRRVLVFSSPMAQYAMHLRDARRVIDFVDIDSDKWRQYSDNKRWPMSRLYAREGKRLLHYEQHVAREFDASLFVSQPEAELFKRLAPSVGDKIGFFSNGVDTDYFAPSHQFDNPYPGDADAMTFTGAMDYWPNIDAVQWFANDIFPAILRAHPAARFYIVGARPTAAVMALAGLPGVHVTGTVPDVRPYLAHARLTVAPLRIARGIQNKVLEAMAMAKPAVVSAQALEGIEAVPGRDLMLATDAPAFEKEVVRQLKTPDRDIGVRARQQVVALYGWSSNLSRVDALLEPVMMRSPEPLAALP